MLTLPPSQTSTSRSPRPSQRQQRPTPTPSLSGRCASSTRRRAPSSPSGKSACSSSSPTWPPRSVRPRSLPRPLHRARELADADARSLARSRARLRAAPPPRDRRAARLPARRPQLAHRLAVAQPRQQRHRLAVQLQRHGDRAAPVDRLGLCVRPRPARLQPLDLGRHAASFACVVDEPARQVAPDVGPVGTADAAGLAQLAHRPRRVPAEAQGERSSSSRRQAAWPWVRVDHGRRVRRVGRDDGEPQEGLGGGRQLELWRQLDRAGSRRLAQGASLFLLTSCIVPS